MKSKFRDQCAKNDSTLLLPHVRPRELTGKMVRYVTWNQSLGTNVPKKFNCGHLLTPPEKTILCNFYFKRVELICIFTIRLRNKKTLYINVNNIFKLVRNVWWEIMLMVYGVNFDKFRSPNNKLHNLVVMLLLWKANLELGAKLYLVIYNIR